MSFRLSSVSEYEIKGIIESLPEKTSSREDEINNIIVKTAGSVITCYLASLINQSFNEGCFSKELRKAKVIPLFKDGSRLGENSYRPISSNGLEQNMREQCSPEYVSTRRILIYYILSNWDSGKPIQQLMHWQN